MLDKGLQSVEFDADGEETNILSAVSGTNLSLEMVAKLLSRYEPSLGCRILIRNVLTLGARNRCSTVSTPWAIKNGATFIFYDNFGKCGPISIILSLLDS